MQAGRIARDKVGTSRLRRSPSWPSRQPPHRRENNIIRNNVVRGEPLYIFGNVGWFDDLPSQRCVQSDWAADWVAQAGKPTEEGECNRGRSTTSRKVRLAAGFRRWRSRCTGRLKAG